MNRRHFNTLGMSAAAVALLRSASGQATQAPSPGNLANPLPSPIPGPGSCSELPELPLPPSDAVTQKLFPGFK